MERITSRLSLILAGAILLAAAVALTTIRRPEDCRPPDILRSHANAAMAADAPTPTLAPPQKVVFVRVETDKSDIEVGWAEN
jgi:hypothetical protein